MHANLIFSFLVFILQCVCASITHDSRLKMLRILTIWICSISYFLLKSVYILINQTTWNKKESKGITDLQVRNPSGLTSLAYRLKRKGKGLCSLLFKTLRLLSKLSQVWKNSELPKSKCIIFLMSLFSMVGTQIVLDNLTKLNFYSELINLDWRNCLTQSRLKNNTQLTIFLTYFQLSPHFIIKTLGSTLNNILIAWKFNHYQSCLGILNLESMETKGIHKISLSRTWLPRSHMQKNIV